MNEVPFLIKYCVPKSTDESISPAPKQQNTFFPVPRFEIQTSAYEALAYPFQPRELISKCHQCSYKSCHQDTAPVRWSLLLNDQLERKSRFALTHARQLDEGQSVSSHHTFQDSSGTTEEQMNERPSESAITMSSTGKRTRTAFTPIQLLVLETAFEKNHYVVGMERKQLAVYLKLSEQQVKVWYQNRRTKYKKNIQQNFS